MNDGSKIMGKKTSGWNDRIKSYRKGDIVFIPHSEDLFLINAILDDDKMEVVDAECSSGEERHFEVHCSDLTFYDSL